ncbi:hypothetical protein O6H91_06G138600 [Diphasiastrum complanatum]|uniref:Uncharacterized protein n=1 Tax=Diphasiastrum complanatum TaxID=34168 RepID=A0ACC2DJC4_DIPCM|nr:hypothetical protein O6H91_06G138600 [Diphasiastrum complanatum]
MANFTTVVTISIPFGLDLGKLFLFDPWRQHQACYNTFSQSYCQPFGDATQSGASRRSSFSQHSFLTFSRSKRCRKSVSYLRSAVASLQDSVSRLSKANEGLLTIHSSADSYPLNELPIVKICGITNPNDAAIAAEAGATYIGMILYPKSKRSVSLHVAKQIARAAREGGAEPVGVFVDEDATTIQAWCDAVGVSVAQLHGDGARAALFCLPMSLKVIYVLHVDKHGILQTHVPAQQECTSIDWILIDGLQGGRSGWIS